jgi:hypothetical protein
VCVAGAAADAGDGGKCHEGGDKDADTSGRTLGIGRWSRALHHVLARSKG